MKFHEKVKYIKNFQFLFRVNKNIVIIFRDFRFNLNVFSSPLMIRIHFDILWTMIANTLYYRFARDLKRFEHCLAPTIFRRFINILGKIIYVVINLQ